MFVSRPPGLYPDSKTEQDLSRTVVPIWQCLHVGAILGAYLGTFANLGNAAYHYAVSAVISCRPAWAFGHSLSTLVTGVFLMQTGGKGHSGSSRRILRALAGCSARTFPGSCTSGCLISSPALPSSTRTREAGYRGLYHFRGSGHLSLILIFASVRKTRTDCL